VAIDEQVEITDENDKAHALFAMETLTEGAKIIIHLTEKNGVRGSDEESLLIPLDLDEEITIVIRKDYRGGIRH